MYSAALNQPTRAAQRIGLRRLLGLIGFCFVLISLGCNADPRCRRETALMRAEILDIEDKYAALQSKYESTALLLHQYTGQPIDQTIYGATSNYHDVILSEEIISNGEITTGDGIYQPNIESYQPGTVVYGTPVQSYSDQPGIIIDDLGPQLNAPAGTLVQPSQNFNLPAEGNIRELDSAPDLRSAPKAPSNPSQESLPLPGDARNRPDHGADDFELNLARTNRRTVPARQASVTLGRSYDNNRNATNQGLPTEIIVNRSMTAGQDVNDSPGDDGLNLLLQTKDANGQIVLHGGELTVSLIDPKQRQRVGFWRFLAGETELFFVDKNENTDGILLHLPWGESVPRRARLLVHVSFVTQDGRTLTTSSDVLIKPPTTDYSAEDPTVIEWTLQDDRWRDAGGKHAGSKHAGGKHAGGSYVNSDVESLEDSYRVENRQRAEESQAREDAWQRNGTYNRGAKFSQSNDRDNSTNRDYKNGRSADRDADAVNNPDQPKWRPAR